MPSCAGADRRDIAAGAAADDEQGGRSRVHRLLHEQGCRGIPASRAAPARTGPQLRRRPRGDRTMTTGSSSCRGTTAPPRITGRSTMRLTPTIATSGWLITGVVTMPPSAPRLVMVMVEPLSSSRVALPPRAASARRAISAARRTTGRAPRHGAPPAPSGPPSVCVAMPMCTAPWRVTTPASSSKRALTCGKLAHRQHDRAHQERQQRQSAALGAPLRVEPRAQRLELGDVDLLDIGEVRNAALGVLHLLARSCGAGR